MLFVKPSPSVYQRMASSDYRYSESEAVPCATYAEYNYLRPGLASRIKLHHFEVALRLTRDCFGSCPVIDFGCADGVFLPSLSRYFPQVVGIDRRADFVEISKALVREMRLPNVTIVCNDALPVEQLREQLPGRNYQIAFLLETVEHVGDASSPWESRVAFIRQVFELLERNGRIVVSVPKMTGLAYLVQRTGLAVLGAAREPITWRNLLRAVFLGDTSELEPQWNGNHLGFNHHKLEQHLRREFDIKRSSSFFQAIYVLQRREKA
jgi:2-polyprenyl-3-methyl-5-hydroxy-6-metoxy-1,4-benzoquinol methylase